MILFLSIERTPTQLTRATYYIIWRGFLSGYLAKIVDLSRGEQFDRCESLTILLSRYALNVLSVLC